jgi:disulfide bond formation protein DsbB
MMRSDALLAGTAAVALGAVGAALVSQHVFGMLPCPWCVLQRLVFVAIAAAAFVALAWRTRLGRRAGALLGVGFAACGAAAALWQHFVAAATASCDMTLADRVIAGLGLDEQWPALFMPLASCADAAVKLLGVPYEFFSFALFGALGAALLLSLRRPGA